MRAITEIASQDLLAAQTADAFRARFGANPRLFSAPGRINLIGEHTDYSEGFVLPAAIDRMCIAAMAPNDRGCVRVYSLNRNDEAQLGGPFRRRGHWTDYVDGVRAALADGGVIVPGCDLAIGSNVPEGAGVSSSAALEVSTMLALLAAANASTSPLNIARWAQRAESTYVGMPCGLMDQFVSANGVAGSALLLDCRSLTFETILAPERAAFLVIDSKVRHKLVDGGYAARRADCEEAAMRLGVSVLRDASSEMIEAAALPERLRRRAQHVVSENKRVQETAGALRRADLARVGNLMDASHASLRDDFNVTCAETDALASIATEIDHVFGARQMGGGFGGAVLALVDRSGADAAADAILPAYRRATGLDAEAFVCTLTPGAREIVP